MKTVFNEKGPVKVSIKHKNRKTGKAEDDYGDEYVSPWTSAKEETIPEQSDLTTQVDVVKKMVRVKHYTRGLKIEYGKLKAIPEMDAE